MTGPGATSASRMRIAGIVLLAVAAVAAVVGLVALGSQGSSSQPAAAPASAPSTIPAPSPGAQPSQLPPSATPGPALPGAGGAGGAGPTGAPIPPSPTGAPGSPAAGAPIVPVPDAGGSGSGGASGGGGGGGGGASTSAAAVRVLNNSTITGLAERAAGDLRNHGWNVVEVGNYPQGIIPLSTAYYRPGTDEQAAAESIAAQTGIRAEPRFAGIESASPGVIVIATQNWGTTAPKS